MVLSGDQTPASPGRMESQLSAQQVLRNSKSCINDTEIERNTKLHRDIYQSADKCRAIKA